jgi:uncharacterized protein YggE
MKKTILLFTASLLFITNSFAQTPKEKSINVVGTAEMEIVPDEIYLSLTLREYTSKDKKKYTIEELEKNLVNYVEKVTLTDKKDIKMDNMSAYVLSMKRKNKDEVISKSYDIKFKNAQQVYMVYAVMDSLGITRASITKYSHSKMDEYKKQIKINAIKAAKDKATYLLEAIGEKVGKAITITETTGFVEVDDGIYDNRYRNGLSNNISQSFSNVSYLGESGNAESMIGDKTIKLSYSINTEFAIQ